MKTCIAFLFLFISLLACGQDCKYCGTFEGSISSNAVDLKITFDLKSDSTYVISMDFNWKKHCNLGKDIWIYKGKWISKKDWLYLEPVEDSEGGSLCFMQGYALDHDSGNVTITERENRINFQSGYRYYLKVSSDKNGTDKIYFHVSWDCFENYWDWNYVEKKSP